jgi:hypothetical protein
MNKALMTMIKPSTSATTPSIPKLPASGDGRPFTLVARQPTPAMIRIPPTMKYFVSLSKLSKAEDGFRELRVSHGPVS